MNNHIPQYYVLITKAKSLASSGKRTDLLESIKYFESAIEQNETDDALSNLCAVAIKLNDVKLYEKNALRGAELGFKHFYFDLGRFYGNIN